MATRVAGRDSGHRQCGFSLLELLTVLVLLAVVAGITAPQLGRLLSGLDFRKQTAAITATFRGIRLSAIASGREIAVRIEENRLLLWTGQEEAEERSLDLGPEDELTMTPATVFFSPQATATPATLTFSSGGRRRIIVLDALTGLPIVE